MKRVLSALAVTGIVAAFALQSCSSGSGKRVWDVGSLECDTTMVLMPGQEASPSCHLRMDFDYLEATSPRDTMVPLINRTLRQVVMGEEFMDLSLEEAMALSVAGYMDDYRADLLSVYEDALKEDWYKDELSFMFSYDYDISTELNFSRDSICNCSVVRYAYTGGAHPNTVLDWTNINLFTGEVMTLEDVFRDVKSEGMYELVTSYLFAELSKRMELDHCGSEAELVECGALMGFDLFVPENFLILDEGVKFLYNRYEIAPYSMGDIQFLIPYDELQPFLK